MRHSAVTIHDLHAVDAGGYLAFDLIDILGLCEPQVRDSIWRISDVECTGDMAGELHAVSCSGLSISGDKLLRLATGVHQVIDGKFEALLDESSRPWLVVRAVDSSFYVVVTNDSMLLTTVRLRFKDVRDSPADAVGVA